MKNKKILFITIFAIFILLILTTKSNASLYLNKLDFYAELDEKGNMHVTETWNIDVSNTNTLFKTFELDKDKYSNITNVKVSEVSESKIKKYLGNVDYSNITIMNDNLLENVEYNFIETNTWAYHLTKNYYFGGINRDGDFEIAWGVGLDNRSATKTYKITYTVVDAVAKYNDCAELYWQFLGDDFEINASKISGIIKMPSAAKTKEDIRAWGHVATLNGEIYIISTDTVEFTLNNYSGGNYVEVRMAMPTEIFGTISRTYNKNMLSNIIEEETEWADKANARRKINEKIPKVIVTIITIIVMIIMIIPTFKYIKILKTTKKLVPTKKFEYFREKLNKDSTPADALFLYNNGEILDSKSFTNIFSAILLNISLKGYFKLNVEKNERGEDETVIYKTQKNIEELKYEEEKIGSFVRSAIDEKEKITIQELQTFMVNNPTGVNDLITSIAFRTESKNKILNNFDKDNSQKKSNYTMLMALYIGLLALTLPLAILLTKKIILAIAIISMLNLILVSIIRGRLSNFTQKGIDEREKWKGLRKYMEDFSLLGEKEIPALEIWEEYLVYATVFGIADKVVKQLKLVYPQIEEMNNCNTVSYVHLMANTSFNTSFNQAINSSISSVKSYKSYSSYNRTSTYSSSSGSGSGGGFSGGGGGGRRPVEADGGR